MKLYRDFIYGPLWLIIVVATALQLAYVAVVGLGWLGVAQIVILTPIFAFVAARNRKRSGGRHEMRRFHDAVRSRQLPTLDSPDEVIRWNQLIVRDRENRRGQRVSAWMMLALGSVYLVLALINAVSGPHDHGLILPVSGAIAVAVSARFLLVNPGKMAALSTLAEQGTGRGYGYSLPAH
ncbi:hypothetical protein [Nocardia heshunensis]